MIQQNHRDQCAATREIRANAAKEQAQVWIGAIGSDADKPRVKAFMNANPGWEKRPLTAYPSGIGSVDSCHDEDAKVGLDTTPALGDMKALVALVKWHG